jgi:hypothetical protein
LILAAAFLALPATPQGLAQEPAPVPSAELLSLSTSRLNDPGLHKELNLSAEQAKKLTALHKRWRDELIKGGADWLEKRKELDRANRKALLAILRPEQLKRLREVLLQGLSGRLALAALPELVQEIGLSQEQKLAFVRNANLEAVLTKEQQAKWKAMLGKPFSGWALKRTAGREQEEEPAPLPERLVILMHRCVEEELKLSVDQARQVQELRHRWQAATRGYVRWEGEKWAARMKGAEVLVEQGIGTSLQPEQRTRLDQIVLQRFLHLLGRNAVFDNLDVREAVRLSRSQEQKLRDIRAERGKGLVELFLGGDSYDRLVEKVEAFSKGTYEEMLGVLSAGQRKRLKERIGEPFRGTLFMGGERATFLASLELEILGEKAVQKELQLSGEQAEKLAELHQQYVGKVALRWTGRGTPWADDKRGIDPPQRAREIDAGLNRILIPRQRQRCRQLALQKRKLYRSFYDVAPEEIVEVVRELGLTAVQKQKLWHGGEVEGVLTKEQQAKWKAMRGEPFAGWPGDEEARLPGRDVLALLSGVDVELLYLEQASVRKELELSEAEVKRLRAIRQQWRTMVAEARELSADAVAVAKKLEAANSLKKDLSAVLQPTQERRFRQILLQQVRGDTREGSLPRPAPSLARLLGTDPLAKSKLAAVLGYPPTARELTLTPGQQEQLRRIDAEARLNLRLLRSLPSDMPRDAPAAFIKVTEEKLLGVLTSRQKKRLKEMLGEPFKGEFQRRRAFDFAPEHLLEPTVYSGDR